MATDTPSGIEFSIEYCADLFTVESIERMAVHYEQLMKSIVKNIETPVSKLPMMAALEEERLLTEFNSTPVYFPDGKTILDLFELQVKDTPEATAIHFEGAK